MKVKKIYNAESEITAKMIEYGIRNLGKEFDIEPARVYSWLAEEGYIPEELYIKIKNKLKNWIKPKPPPKRRLKDDAELLLKIEKYGILDMADKIGLTLGTLFTYMRTNKYTIGNKTYLKICKEVNHEPRTVDNN